MKAESNLILENSMYYGLIVLSVLMFGGGFALQDEYRKTRGSGIASSLESSFVGALAGFVVLLVLNGFKIEFTPFTVLIAALSALNSIMFTFCAFGALNAVNLSLFSMYSMLGGMVLPFLQGIIFYEEKLTLAKLLCLLVITAALIMTVTRKEKKSGTAYYVGVFVLNGASGVLSKIFASSSAEKTSSLGFSVWIAILTALLSGILLPIFMRRQPPPNAYSKKLLCIGAANGAIGRVANYLLVLALAHVDASVQYPMVTGGVMIVSTLICFIGARKPSRRELISVLLAFIGTLLLFVIPI